MSADVAAPLIAGWLDTLTVAPKTLMVYRKTLALACLEMDPYTCTPDEVATWIADHFSTPAGQATATGVLRRFYGWLAAQGLREHNPIPLGVHATNGNGPARNPTPATWTEPIDRWQGYLTAAGHSEQTRHTYLRWMTAFATAHPDGPDVTRQQVIDHFAAHPHWKPNTRKNAGKAVRSFYRWAEQFDVSADHSTVLPKFKVPAGMPRPADDVVFADALRRASDRGRLMLLLGAHAGLRRQEIARVHARDITDNGLMVLGKGGRTRIVPLTPLLRRELRAAGPGYVFPSRFDPGKPISSSAVGANVRQALGGQASTHQLRHRFGTRAYAGGGKNLLAVQQLLGHSDPSVTAIYVQLGSEDLKAAVEAAAG